METFFIYNLGIGAIYCFLLSFAMTTQNLPSAIFFKLFPFFLGLGLTLNFIKNIGWI